MPTFVDEGGSTGTGRGSHGYFRVAGVWLPRDRVLFVEQQAAALRRELGLPPRHPFKFHTTEQHPDTRERLFRIGLDAGMWFTACHVRVNEPAWRGPHRQQHIHWFAAVSVAAGLRPLLLADWQRHGDDDRDRVTVDRCDDGRYLDELTHAFLGVRPNPEAEPLTRSPAFKPDERHSGLQLADLVCGAVGSHLEALAGSPNGDFYWYRLIRSRGVGGDERHGPGVCVK